MIQADNKNYNETIAKIVMLCIFNETPDKATFTNPFSQVFGMGKLAIARLSAVPLDVRRG